MEDSSKHLVGQPIFKQILDLIPKNKFDRMVQAHKSNRYYKTFDSWTHLMTMLFGVFSRCDSMGEICDGMQALAGKLNHLGLGLATAPAKSTAGDGLRGRDNEFFKEVYFMLLNLNYSQIFYYKLKLLQPQTLMNVYVLGLIY